MVSPDVVPPDVVSPDVAVPVDVEPVAVGSVVLDASDVVTVDVEPAVVVGSVVVDGATVVALGAVLASVELGAGVELTGEETVVVGVGEADTLVVGLGAAVVEAAVDVMKVPGWSASTIALISSVYA